VEVETNSKLYNLFNCLVLPHVKAEAAKFLWKRKHFDQRSWKRKQQKILLLPHP